MVIIPVYNHDFKIQETQRGILSVIIPNNLTFVDEHGKNRILVSNLIPLLQHFLIEPSDSGLIFLPILSVHCRRDPGLPCVMPTGKSKIKHLTSTDNPKYVLIEAHGSYREGRLELRKGLFEDNRLYEHLQKNVFYRAPIGSRCRQLEYHQIYDNDIRCRIQGDYNPDIAITDDGLMIQDMRISIRHMTDVCDVVLQTQGTLRPSFPSPLSRSFSLPQRGSVPYGASPLSSKSSRSKRTPRISRWLSSQKTKKSKRKVSRIQEEPETPSHHGGALKKRRRKTKSRNRRR
jgi:hypothetical protein